MSGSVVSRFAPSPNGYLHLGHAYSALVAYRAVKAMGGRFLLRIEDIDTARCREAYVSQIYDDLSWLGLSWEDPVLRQSAGFLRYAEAVQTLKRLGVLYPCFASRREIQDAAGPYPALDPDGSPLYPGVHKRLPADEIEHRYGEGQPFCLRIDMDKALAIADQRLGGRSMTYRALTDGNVQEVVIARPDRWGDAVIVRKDVPASYHLAVVVDDAFQGVTHVTRGQDLQDSTDIHCLLQILLDLPQPAYSHHGLVLGADGQKLSKSAGDTAIRSLRASGWTAEDVQKACYGGAVDLSDRTVSESDHR